MTYIERKRSRSVYERHARSCSGRPCNCQPTFRASVSDGLADGERVRHRRTFKTLDAAIAWRDRLQAEVNERRGREVAAHTQTLTDLSRGYSNLRKTQQMFDALVRGTPPPRRAVVRESLMHLYAAEDSLKEVL